MADTELTEEEIEARERLIEQLLEQARTGEKSIDAALKLWQENTKLGKSFVTTREATQKFTGGLKDSAKALGGSTGNFNDLSAVVTGTISAVSGLLGKIPVLGSTFAALGDAAAETANFAFGQVQQGFDSFQELSRAGITASDGISGVATRMREAHMPIQTYTKLLAENSANLAYFSESAIDGGKKFSTIMNNMAGEAGKPLRRLGLSVEEIGQTVVDFQKLNQRLGYEQTLTQSQLQQKSMDYAAELDLVAKLTGQNRKDLQKAREEQASDARFRAKLNELYAQNKTDEAIALNDYITTLKQQSPELARAAMDLSTGFINSDAAIKATTSGMTDTMKGVMQDIESGNKTAVDGLNATAAQAKEMAKVGGYQQQAAKVFQSGMAPFINYAELSDLGAVAMKDVAGAAREQEGAMKSAGSQTDKLVTSMMEMQEATSAVNAFFINTKTATDVIDVFSTTMLKTITFIEKGIMENETMGEMAYDLNPLKGVGEDIGSTLFEWKKAATDWWESEPGPTAPRGRGSRRRGPGTRAEPPVVAEEMPTPKPAAPTVARELAASPTPAPTENIKVIREQIAQKEQQINLQKDKLAKKIMDDQIGGVTDAERASTRAMMAQLGAIERELKILNDTASKQTSIGEKQLRNANR